MTTKEEIINNLREYSASDVAQALKCGVVTMYELSKSGKLSPLMKKRIEEQLALEPVEEAPAQSTSGHIHVNNEPALILEAEIPVEISKDNSTVNTTHLISQTLSPNIISEDETNVIDNKGMFRRVFSFKGRIRRAEFGLSYIIFCVWYFIFISVTEMEDLNPVLTLLIILSLVPAYWFLWAQGAKRCHDRGNSGWYQIIPFYFLVMLFGASEEGINDYGTNPKE